jgi:predicted amidohydrolase YtcJ
LGMTGTVEHAQLLRDEDVARFAELGLTASVQPEHAMDDRDVADVYWEGRTGRAFALHSLHQAGVRLRLGSDAPVSPLNPWIQIAAAVTRSRDGRAPWHPEQAITVQTALEASTRGGLQVEQGDLADLILVDYDPLTCDPDLLRSMPVSATMLAGGFTHYAL